MRKITSVKATEGFKVAITFDDGVSGTVDLADLAGKGVFALWLDPGAFARVRVGAAGGLLWGDDVDLCPDALYLKLTGQKPEDIFPALRREAASA